MKPAVPGVELLKRTLADRCCVVHCVGFLEEAHRLWRGVRSFGDYDLLLLTAGVQLHGPCERGASLEGCDEGRAAGTESEMGVSRYVCLDGVFGVRHPGSGGR